MSKDLKEVRDVGSQMSDGKAFQAEETTGAEALRWDP